MDTKRTKGATCRSTSVLCRSYEITCSRDTGKLRERGRRPQSRGKSPSISCTRKGQHLGVASLNGVDAFGIKFHLDNLPPVALFLRLPGMPYLVFKGPLGFGRVWKLLAVPTAQISKSLPGCFSCSAALDGGVDHVGSNHHAPEMLQNAHSLVRRTLMASSVRVRGVANSVP